MPASILIAYATRSGSTKEVAETINATLRDAGLWPDLLPMSEVDTLQGRTAVILGAPLYIGRFPSEFHAFMARFRTPLSVLRPWTFVLGPTRNQPADFDAARKQAAQQLRRYPWLKPADLQIFGGRWSTATLPFPFSFLTRLPAMKNVPASDIRDWPAIRNWTLAIADQLKPAA